jgi:hypothetical protein
MRKAYNTDDAGVLDIKPMEDIVPEGLPSPQQNKSFKHEEVFVNKKVGKSRMELIQEAEVEEVSDITDPSETESNNDVESITNDEPPPKKRGRGKRGKDKKKRVKKPPTEKQLAHLARIRELSKQRREAKKLEKERIKLEIKNKAKENTKKNATINPPKIINKTATKKPTQVIQNTPPPPNPHQNNINPTNISQAPSMEQFFNLMDKYEEYKVKRNAVKKTIPKSQSLPTGRKIAQKYKPEPIIDHNPLINEPKNPFDVCFSYGGKW